MKQLWAPWRMQYITGVDRADGCFLCDAVRSGDDARSLVVFRLPLAFCMLNRFPYNNGHLLIAPAEHKGALDELTDSEALEIHGLLARAIRALEAAMQPQGFNVGLNLGRPAGAGLPGHLHWHVVPRWNGDTNFMPILADVKVVAQSLEHAHEMLCRAFGSPSNGSASAAT